jgi:hypothetical protein
LTVSAATRHLAPAFWPQDAAGVEFIDENGGGLGVRLRKQKKG